VKNKLTDLNNHLFAQVERLSDEGLKGKELAEEIERGKAISGVAKDIIANAALVLDAQKVALEHGPKTAMPALLALGDDR
jgi:hypothetical protein